jgi:MinD-like ATPase involved in chromosome partitioning or flagellar assembly
MGRQIGRSTETMQPESMDKNGLVLLIGDDRTGIELIRGALAPLEGWFRLQCVGSLLTGQARIAGGGVNLVLLDLALCRGEGDERLGHFHKLHEAAPGVPIVLLCSVEEENLALSAVRGGAADYMLKERCATDLDRLLLSVIERHSRPLDSARTEMPVARKSGTIITVLGAKGGVGTTTVALNVGSVLARRNKSIVAELRPTFGTLAQFFRTQSRNRSITCLLAMEPATIAETHAASCLWPYRNIPGLSFLFGPQTMEPCQELGQAHAKAIVAMLARLADFVVVDLPTALSQANRAAIQVSNLLALVVERDPISVQAAKVTRQAIEAWNDAPEMGAVIVNRTPLNVSASIAEIELQIGVPILGVIPPAQDVCCAAQNAHTPLVVFDPESLAAGSMTALAERLAYPFPANSSRENSR